MVFLPHSSNTVPPLSWNRFTTFSHSACPNSTFRLSGVAIISLLYLNQMINLLSQISDLSPFYAAFPKSLRELSLTRSLTSLLSTVSLFSNLGSVEIVPLLSNYSYLLNFHHQVDSIYLDIHMYARLSTLSLMINFSLSSGPLV